MSHPNRDVNGSGRILFKTYSTERDYTVSGTWGGSPHEYPTKRVLGSPQEGHIKEWSSNGDYVRILPEGGTIYTKWYARTDIELIEVLPS